jgi:hypothetical protein
MGKRPSLSIEELYSYPFYIEMAKSNAISAERLSIYARALHNDPEVVADLKFAHEADVNDYSIEDYQNLGRLLSRLMYTTAQKTAIPNEPRSLLKADSAMSDFNAWYLQKVVYGKEPFEDSLSEYLKVSPCVKREADK